MVKGYTVVKKNPIYLIFVLLLMAGLTWQLLKDENAPERGSSGFHRNFSGPEFQNEGQLFFLHPGTRDTLESISIEVADTPEKISRGLMYRTELGSHEGMLFVYNQERNRTFWMKNTEISLDILFIDGANRIVHIARHTIPYSRDPITSVEPAKYVLEVNAGFCNKAKIESGYRVEFIIHK